MKAFKELINELSVNYSLGNGKRVQMPVTNNDLVSSATIALDKYHKDPSTPLHQHILNSLPGKVDKFDQEVMVHHVLQHAKAITARKNAPSLLQRLKNKVLGEATEFEFEQSVIEMAQQVGKDEHLSMLTVSPKWRHSSYKALKNDRATPANVGIEDVNLHHGVEKDENGKHVDRYAILDHGTKETLTYQRFVKHNPGDNGIHFPHYEQEATDRMAGGRLPNGMNRAVAFRHLKTTGVPLVSSASQSESGHKMWRKMVTQAVSKGTHHVYYHDGKDLHKTTADNMEDHLNSYYGNTPEHANRKMILSKTEL